MTDGTAAQILSCLQGLKYLQQDLRGRELDGAAMRLLLSMDGKYARRLPEEVIRRLSEADAVGLRDFPADAPVDEAERLARSLSSDSAFAQIIRAANVYREKRGYAPLGPDGWPE